MKFLSGKYRKFVLKIRSQFVRFRKKNRSICFFCETLIDLIAGISEEQRLVNSNSRFAYLSPFLYIINLLHAPLRYPIFRALFVSLQ